MENSEEELRQLRTRLSAYRAKSGGASWQQVAQELLSCPGLPDSFIANEHVGGLAEALRRFSSASQVPSARRLDAINAFLADSTVAMKRE